MRSATADRTHDFFGCPPARRPADRNHLDLAQRAAEQVVPHHRPLREDGAIDTAKQERKFVTAPYGFN